MSDLARPTAAALLGCGHPHSGSHLETLCSLTEVTAIHLWDPDPELARALAGKVKGKPVVVRDALDALLSDEAVGWVLASLRNDVSPAALLACAEAGRSVLTEKPIGRSLAEVEPVVAAFRDRGLPLGVCFQNRLRPAAVTIREWVANGLLGRLCSLETRLHTTQVRLRDPRHWLFDRALAGGGILPWLGCHMLDLLRYLTGLEVTEVSAQAATLSGETIDVEDMAVLTLRFDNSALATATFGYLMPSGGAGNLFAGKDTYLGLKGTLGDVAWAPMDSDQTVCATSFGEKWAGAPRRIVRFEEAKARAYGGGPGLEFARRCLRAAQGDGAPPATGEDMLAVWRIMEAAYESQATGRRVSLT